jgi:hypothetical protein
MKNRYIHRAKISEKKFRELLKLFCLDLTATQIAGATGINRNTVNRYMTEIRCRISEFCCEREAGDIPCSREACLPAVSRGQERPNGEICLIGIVKNNGKISCRLIPERKAAKLQPPSAPGVNRIRNRISEEGENYAGLIDLRRMKYFKLNGGDNGIHKNGGGIDICEGFWGVARSRLQRFRGLRKTTFQLHIRECEFRYNHGQKEMYPLLLRMIREQPLFQ